ncbi:Ras-associated and pleckstrin homology domains-containing protein 1-like [Oopsacas minuta]|uniref:Ras-associated and pleckstrin homology domains-containing protein 1-like n=1 Tax=Oopsacas minuta TaxID=111878 RepID=A0AAV7JMN2_9METZ|nr:Ras-associated and pleckstrin homology domains-containing protein 1-like [Oopsacas minuta]
MDPSPPPPLPFRNSRTKLSSDKFPYPNPPPLPSHSTSSDVPMYYSSCDIQTDFPPIPPAPITEIEIAQYHQKHNSRSSVALSGKDSRLQSAVNNVTGPLRLGKHPKKNREDFTQSCKNPPNNEVQILFGEDQITYSFEEDRRTPQKSPCKQEVLPYKKQDIITEPMIYQAETHNTLSPSASSPQPQSSHKYSSTLQQDEFNVCSPPNDLLAACLNELSTLQGFSPKQSETDSNSSNFSLQELSQLKSPSMSKIESNSSLDTSMKCDDLGIEDLDALIADLDEMTQAIQTDSEPSILPSNPPPIISPKPILKPEVVSCEDNAANCTPEYVQPFNQPSNLCQTEAVHSPAAQITQSVALDSKQAKISLALSKLKRANQKRVVLKIYDINMSYKMVVIDENMISRCVCTVMAEKNHQTPGPNWCLVELLGALGLERTIEDHEKVLDVLSHWPRQHNNVIMFKNISDKYLLLKKPQLFMPSIHPLASENESKFDDATRRRILIKELFYDKTLPPIANVVNIKIGKKGSWRKIYCVLRTSGLYYSKSKRASTKDLVNLVTWKNVGLYRGQRYGELYKSPEKFCCSLIPAGPLDQTEKSIVHLSFSNKQRLDSWIACISLAKYSIQLFNNYLQNFELYPWLENGGELTNPESDPAVTPRSQESALTSEEKQMLHNELQMTSLTNPLIDSLDVLDEKKSKFNQSFDSEMRDSIKKSSKIAATFSNAWVAGDSTLPPRTASIDRSEDNSIDRQQPFSYTQSIPAHSKFTLV